MAERFPPTSRRTREIHAAVTAYGAVFRDREAIYVSSPLTTGRRAVSWRLTNGARTGLTSNDDFEREVIARNRLDATRYVNRLRKTSALPVIDPAGMMDIAGWTQSDYRVFWGRVIESYAREVIFRDGWEYSRGCVYEFLVAHASKARAVDEHRRRLSLVAGRACVAAATEDLRARGVAATFHEQAWEALGELGSGVMTT